MPFNPKYQAVDPTLIEGQFTSGRVDQNGRLLVNTGGAGSGTTTTDFAGTISAANSTTTNLTSGAAFTGTSVDTLKYGAIVVNVFASHASAVNGLSIQQSSNGTNWDITDTFTVSASTALKVVIPVQAAFARVVYTNGGTTTTTLRLQTILKPQMPVASALKPADAMSGENDFISVVNVPHVFSGASYNQVRDVGASINGGGTGVMSAGLIATFDDVSVAAALENNYGPVRMSSDRILYTAPAPTGAAGAALNAVTFATSAAASSLVLKASAGNLYGINVATGGTAGYVMLFNATSAPADGAVTPLKVYGVAANSTFNIAYTPPLRYPVGLTVVFSSTGPFTKTASATAFISGEVI